MTSASLPWTPVSMAPTSPQSLGMEPLAAITVQETTIIEQSHGYIQSTQAAAVTVPPGTQVTKTTSYAIIVPSGTIAVNDF
jgi:hypothetical protein